MSFSGSYGITQTIDERFNQVNGGFQAITKRNTRVYGISTKYSFSAPGGIGIPLLGRIKFNSTMSIDLSVKFNEDRSESKKTENGKWVKGVNKSNFTISPVISYAFSRQIRGGITGRWQDNNDARYNRKSHVRELQIWTEIKF